MKKNEIHIRVSMILSVMILLLLISAPGWATTYYVSNNGSDSSSGTSTGSPWKTVSKVNGASFSPGDSILFERGDTWNEQLKPSSSGSTTGGYITYGAYGSGNKPILNGNGIGYMIYDGSGRDYLIFENLDVRSASQAGIYNVYGSTHWYIQDCIVHDIGSLSSEVGTGFLNRGSYITVRRCTFYNNGRHGMSIWNDSSSAQTDVVYEYNDVYNFNHTGIDIQAGSGTVGAMKNITIRYNKIHEVDSWSAPAMYVDGTSSCNVNNLRIYGNIMYNITGRGIVLGVNCSPVYIYNNTLYDISDQAYALRNASGTVYIHNNIGMNSGTYNLRVDDSTNKHIDYNCWYQGSGYSSTIANVNGSSYSNWTSYKNATGFDAHSIWAVNPNFTNASSGDFSLRSDSVCVNAGTSLDGTYADALGSGSSWPGGVILLDQNANGSSWDIGAFLYGSGSQSSTQPDIDVVAPNPPIGLSLRMQ